MSEPKVSERMFDLVSDFGADCVNHGCNQLRPMVGYPLIENVQHREKEAALLSAIAEIEQRAEKACALYDCGTSSCLCGGLLEPLHGGQHTNGPCQCTPMQLRQAVFLARQRAEKWKEAAVSAEHIFLGYEALEEADLDTEGAVDTAERLLTQAIERNNAAKKALGDEWDEAVKGEG